MKPPKTQYAFTHAVLASNKKAAETGKAGALGDTSTSEKPCLEFLPLNTPSNLTLSRFCLPPLSGLQRTKPARRTERKRRYTKQKG